MKILTQLWHGLLSHLEIYLALLAGSTILVRHWLDLWHPLATGHEQAPSPQGLETLFSITLFLIMALLISDLRKGFQSPRERERIREIGDRIGKIELTIGRFAQSLFDKRVALRTRPTQRRDYADLWAGYKGQYFAYNPSYCLENFEGMEKEQLIKDIYVERYKDENFNACYVFLTGDEIGRQDLQAFRKLMTRVKQLYPGNLSDITQKIEVRVLNEKAARSDAEMYIGIRDGLHTAVVEMKDLALGPKRGEPHYYMIVNDGDVIKYFKNHFHDAWMAAKTIDIFA